MTESSASDPLPGPLTRTELAALAVLLLVGFALRFGLAVALPNIYRPDEIYQTLEPAHRLLTGWGVVTWEWREGIRSWMFPGALAGVLWFGQAVGLGHAGALGLVTAVLSLLSLAAILVGFLLGRRQAGLIGATICGVVTALWPDLVYLGPKSLIEVQSGNLLIAAVGLVALVPRDRRGVTALVGFLLGLAFCLRIQLAPVLLLVAAWRCGSGWRRDWLPLCLGAALPLIGLGVLDFLTLGTPFQSVWKNIQVNLLEGRSRDYGVEGPGWYLATMFGAWGSVFVPLGLLFALGIRGAKLPAAVAVAAIAVHSAVAHKEFSFIYAAMPPLLIVAGIGTCRLLAMLRAALAGRVRAGVLGGLTLAVWVWLSFMAALHGGYRHGLLGASDNLRALEAVHTRTDICGLIMWFAGFPSYAHIDRPIPSYLPRTLPELAEAAPAANYIILAGSRIDQLGDATIEQCWGGICLAHRTQSCTPVAKYEANTVLIRERY